MFAPNERSSRATRSPTLMESVATAVVTAIPSATAATPRSFRFRRRVSDLPTILLSIFSAEDTGGARKCRPGNDQHIVLHQVVDVDGVASASRTDGRNINRRAAVSANDVLALLIVTLGTTNLAGIQGCVDRIRRINDGDKPDFRSIHSNLEMVELVVLQFRDGNADNPIRETHLNGGPGCLRNSRINKIRTDEHNDDKPNRACGHLPEALAPLAGQHFAALRGSHLCEISFRSGTGADLFRQNQEEAKRYYGDKEKCVTVSNGADDSHRPRPGRKNPSFRKLVVTRNQQLNSDHQKHQTGDTEKPPKVDPHAPFEESDAQSDGQGKTQDHAHQVHQLRSTQGNGAQKDGCLSPFARNHQQNERKDPPGAGAAWLAREH